MLRKLVRVRSNAALPKRGVPVKIAIVLPSLERGGAELQAVELANRLDPEQFAVTVVSLSDKGELGAALQNVSIELISNDWKALTFYKLVRIVRSCDIVHSFLLKANVYLLMSKVFAPRVKIIIGLRDAIESRSRFYDSAASKLKVTLLCWLARSFSFLATMQVMNSYAAIRLSRGNNITIIHNGVDTERFRPDPNASERLRNVIGVKDKTPIVGIVANCSVYKDYPTFIRAASLIIRTMPYLRFVSMGNNRTPVGDSAMQLVKELGLDSFMYFLGCRHDIEQLLPGMDVLCSSSLEEGFSNAICEAMACGVPCVVTNVGDSAAIVGGTGIAVESGNVEQLAESIIQLLILGHAERQTFQIAARQRAVSNFGMIRMVSRYQDLYRHVLYGTSYRYIEGTDTLLA